MIMLLNESLIGLHAIYSEVKETKQIECHWCNEQLFFHFCFSLNCMIFLRWMRPHFVWLQTSPLRIFLRLIISNRKNKIIPNGEGRSRLLFSERYHICCSKLIHVHLVSNEKQKQNTWPNMRINLYANESTPLIWTIMCLDRK